MARNRERRAVIAKLSESLGAKSVIFAPSLPPAAAAIRGMRA
jgi:hypothetical protein